MAKITLEIWEEVCDGVKLHTCCYAGPRGTDSRRTLSPDSNLLTTFKAGSHFEAMTIYNRYLGRETYTTNQASDFEPYPEEWLAEQENKPD